MDSGCQSYESLRERLFEVGCPHKLYEARLHALEVVSRQPLYPLVQEVITNRIGPVGGAPGWEEQFKRDMRTYGLMEAIHYFHGYPELSTAFIDEACELYERLAKLYLRHHDEIRRSDDPRVLVQLHYLRRLGDAGEHLTPRPRQPPRRPSGEIAEPRRPALDPAYELRLPLHVDFLEVMSWMAKKPVAPGYGCFADELCEALTSEFHFGSFPGVQSAFFEVAEVLEEHEVEVFGSEGQYVLAKLVEHLQAEVFGDYERWIPCAVCGESFFVEVSLKLVNESLIAGEWRCEDCRRPVAEEREGNEA